ncbi:alpha/beta fold hydrolase [Azorhizobium sp. AG788]|uniref:alpha/beta fold hydrolase n=1 Tax=Azorhizobium sp. AG788 TaxID=2183897 RepID=UPI00313973A1
MVAIATTFAVAVMANAFAADYPAPKTGMWIAKDFKFHTGEVLPELKLGYTTVGEPSGEPVLILHGTTGSAASMLTPAFAGELFGPGQPLDARRYYVILTDSIGAGTSSKPSEGLRAKFPRYNYDDMVRAQYDLVTKGLGVKHLRMIIGYSMGGMHAWLWSSKFPDMADIMVPMASQPTEMSSRNWIMRRMIIDAVRNDPDWKGGDYTQQPKAVQVANVFFGIATNGGTLALQNMAPTREKADALLDARLKMPLTVDANDFLYQWDASRDYNAAPGLDKITATLLAINSADDERNPPETGIMDREIKHVKNGRVLLVPASADTRGHATLSMAKFYAKDLADLLATAPRAAPAK